MTKTLKLTDDYVKLWNCNELTKNKFCVNGKIFFYYARPPINEGESFRPKDISNDPTKVAIYDLSTAPDPKNVDEEDLANYIIRYEGSNADTPTDDVECYGVCAGETVDIPDALADKLLNIEYKLDKKTQLVENPEFEGQTELVDNIIKQFEEVI